MRLNKFLAESGVGSRRAVEQLILAGLVSVNGKVITTLATTIDPLRDAVKYQNKLLRVAQKTIYAFNKPVGVTSTVSDPYADKVVADFFPKKLRLYPVGRLDKNSSGLLLVTNSGDIANQLTHPRYQHEKEYLVELIGPSDKLSKLSGRFMLDGARTQPMKVGETKVIKPRHWQVSLILKEGKNRQIRRIANNLGFKVHSLTRVRIGKLMLGDLQPGKYRPVAIHDIL